MRSRHAVHVGLLLLAALFATGCEDRRDQRPRCCPPRRRPPTEQVALPNKEGSFKFGVLGDFGTGAPPSTSSPTRWRSSTDGSSTTSS